MTKKKKKKIHLLHTCKIVIYINLNQFILKFNLYYFIGLFDSFFDIWKYLKKKLFYLVVRYLYKKF